MADPNILKIPAAERLVAAYYEIFSDKEKPTTAKSIAGTRECQCTCHGDNAAYITGGTWRDSCTNNLCSGCHYQRERVLTDLHHELMLQHEICCTSVTHDNLDRHFVSLDHLTRVHHVWESDLLRMKGVISALPQFYEHRELWIPLMKAVYGFGVLNASSVADIRLEFIARQLLTTVDPGATRFLRKLYPSRVIRAEQNHQSPLGHNNYCLSLTGLRYSQSDAEVCYAQRPGQPLAESYWGESYS